MLDLIGGLAENAVGLEAVGEVTAVDYGSVAMPAIERVRVRSGRPAPLRLGFALHGLHGRRLVGRHQARSFPPLEWDRIAVVTDHEGIETLVEGFGWMIPGEVRLFPISGLEDAKAWVNG